MITVWTSKAYGLRMSMFLVVSEKFVKRAIYKVPLSGGPGWGFIRAAR
jgi:hypothetical protein